MTDIIHHYCACCRCLVLPAPAASDVICPVCYWRDDGDRGADFLEARRNYVSFGASREEYRALVRPAEDFERRGFEAGCSGCDHAADAEWVQGEYHLADGVLLHVREELAWCHEESRLVHAEALPPIEELVAELAAREALADVEAQDEVTGLLITREHRANRVAEARAALDWRRRRVSPARCLSCGSTAIAPLWRDEAPAHPGCPGGGHLLPTIMSSCLMTPEHPPGFSEEGLRVQRAAP